MADGSPITASPGQGTDPAPTSRKRGKMPEDELLSLLAQYEQASLGSQVSAGATVSTTVYPSDQALTTLELDRYNALNAYYARPLGNEIENRSQVVLPTLRDTIEWAIPQLMRMFVGGKVVCQFDPSNENDTQQAEIETQTVNHIFMNENNGVIILHDFFKDALLMRNGYVKVETLEEKEVTEERYSGLTEDELTMILQDNKDEDIEVVEQSERQVDLHGPQFGPMTVFDLRLKRRQVKKRTKVCCLPPEEMRVTPRAREGMENLVYACHVVNRARSDLLQDGYAADWVDSLAPGRPNWLEIDALARSKVVDQLSIENPSDRAMQEIEVREVICRVDFDGDGIAELRRIVVAGDKIGENEVIEETPFVSCAGMRMPHRHTGLSFYDLVMDLQIISTNLWRQGLDNLTIANNTRVAVDWRSCNFDDLLSSRPGGVVRGQGAPQSWIMPLEQPSNLISEVMPALDYIDKLRSNRTGIGKGTMGLDADELQNVTKGGQLASMSAAALILEMIARLLAEGVKGIFLKIHSELMRNQDHPLELEISGRWLKVDPTQWRRRTKITVNVGLGSGNREEMRANVMMLGQSMATLQPTGMVGPKQMYEAFKVMCDSLGFPNPERFAMDPSSPDYKQHMQELQQQQAMMPPAPPVQAAQIKAKAQIQSEQMKDQRETMATQADLLKTKMQLQQDRVLATQQQTHEAGQGHRDREVQLDQSHLQILLALIKSLAQIEAQKMQAEQNMQSIGAQFAADTITADREIENAESGK